MKMNKFMRFTILIQKPQFIFLVIPKKHIATLDDLQEEDKEVAGHILLTAQRLAKKLGCEEGFRVVMNCNELGGQTVYHIHMHVLGQRQLDWPPG